MFHSDTQAVCRGCGLVLRGKPYFMGGDAYHPRTKRRCPSNHFGGFVCSPQCDWRASLEQEQSMPGHGVTQRSPSTQSLIQEWPQ
jgi:hypothetical protein